MKLSDNFRTTNKAVGEVKRIILPFYGALIAALFLVTYVPAISLALPRLFLGKF